MRKLSLLACAGLVIGLGAQAAVYNWNKSGSQSWTTSTNWTPTRSTPAAGDTLIFANGLLDTVTDLPTQTVARLLVTNNTILRLMTSGGSHTLTISGSMQVDPGSSFDPSATNQANTVLITLASGAGGTIDGSMLFHGANHKLDAVSAGGIHFRTGSSCTQDTMVGGNLFTTSGTANAVYFDSGSVFHFKCNQGANPFGLTQPSSKVVFSHGSLYRHLKNILPSFSGRTYADFELDCPTANFSATGTGVCTFDTLRIVSGKLKLNLTRRINVLGNIVCTGGANDSLIFNPAGVCSLVLAGAAAQTVRGTSPLYLAGGENLFINNSAGILLQRPLTLNRTLYLQNGTVSTGSDTLKIASDSTIVRTNGHVIGNLNLHVAAGNPIKLYAVGTANGYSPAQIGFNTVTTPGMINCRTEQGSHPALSDPDSCIRRYWSFDNNGVAFTDYSATFSYLAADFGGTFTEASYEATMIPAKYDASWSFPAVGTRTPGGPSDGGSIQATGMAAFSDFTMVKGIPSAVSLSSFFVVWENNETAVRWLTESESGSYLWILARSDTKEGPYTDLSRTPAAGSSCCLQEYRLVDRSTEPGRTYYYLLFEQGWNGSKVGYGPLEFTVPLSELPQAAGLRVHPNPASHGDITINFTLAAPARPVLSIYNVLGQRVRVMAGSAAVAGDNRFQWDGHDQQGRPVPPGLYICRLNAGKTVLTSSLTLVR